MRILIIGAGLSGCSIARLLKDRNHEVLMIEKESNVGGLCKTKVSSNGIKYEPFGARTFHTKYSLIKDFITQFDEFNGYIHRKGMIINQKLFPFPLTKNIIKNFEEKDQILRELKNRPIKIDNTNFETACISIFGKTLYNYIIRNYTLKMWGIDPKQLTAEWAPKRLELRGNDDNRLFKEQWQGLPKNGYSYLIENMIKDISIKFNTTDFNPKDYDVVVSSAPLDKILNYKFGKLEYRSLNFDYLQEKKWENSNYGTINLPQHQKYIRKCNFKILHKQESEHNWIQYQEPIVADDNHVSMYPINTTNNNEIFDKYLKEICNTKNICSIGRLGLFKYLDMDKSVAVAHNMLPIVEKYLNMSCIERYKEIKMIREKY